MPEWKIALICLASVIVAVLISSFIKIIMEKVAKDNGGELDCKKWEYLYAAISFVIAAVGVFCFLRFYVGVTDVNVLIKNTGLYAGSTQCVYFFIVQLIRKGGKGILEKLKNIYLKLRASNNPVQELPEIIKDETDTNNEAEEVVVNTKSQKSAVVTTEHAYVTKLKTEFVKIMTGENK